MTTPKYGFPLPPNNSRIADFPKVVRDQSQALEDLLPGAMRQAAGEYVPAEVARQAQPYVTKATEAAQTVEDLTGPWETRLDGLEQMAGIEPGSVVDGQTANLIAQEASSTRTALNAASAQVAHQVVGSAPLVVVHGDDLNTPRPDTPRPVTWAGTVRPYNMAEQDVWDRYRGETSVFESFAGPGFAGWTPMWTEPSSWAVQSGSLVHTPTVNGRKALTCDTLGDVVDVELVARVSRTGSTGSVGAGLVARASGTTAQADNVIAACFNNMIHLSHTVRGSWQGLASAPFPVPTGPYWIRFQVQNQHLRAKAWVDGTSEPSGWMVETTQWTINGPGRAGAMASENAGQQWDQIGFGIGTSAPVAL